MLKTTPITFGRIKGTIYDFEEIDDILEKHWHTENNNHITIVVRGSFRATGTNWEKIIKAGDVLDWEPYQQHEFKSLESNSRFINIVKGDGEPFSNFGEIR
jgi:hypothetical protein